MIAWFSPGPGLAVDNILVALALAPACRRAGCLGRLTAWFCAVEALAPLGGMSLRFALPPGGWAGSAQGALLITLGLSLMAVGLAGRVPTRGRLATRARRWLAAGAPETWIGRRGVIPALAMVLGLDNLVGGAALSPAQALACGLTSAVAVALACAGARIRLPAAPWRTLTCGALLLTAGVL